MPLQLLPGDVLMFSNGADKSVLIGQKIISVGRNLRADYVHAGLVTNSPALTKWNVHQVSVAHAISAGMQLQNLALSKAGGWLRVDIWRAPNHLSNTAQAAAQVASTWCGNAQSKHMQFSVRKAFMAGFGSSSYGNGAQDRVTEYQNHQGTVGGPPSLKSTSVNKSMFCSMFVVAAWQAALGNSVTTEMNVDSRYVSPMKLHDVLNQKSWNYVGAAFNSGSEVTVVGSNGNVVGF
jgi:hypothetical protein